MYTYILLLNYCVLFTNLSIAQTCNKMTLVKQYANKRLDGYKFGETTAKTVHACVGECMFLTHCKSINFARDNGSCEMNTVDSTSPVETEMLSVDGYIYAAISDWPRVSTCTCIAGFRCTNNMF